MQFPLPLNLAARRRREAVSAPDAGTPGGQCKRFPYGDRIYRYGCDALRGNWERLHLGDREPWPSPDNLRVLLAANPRLEAHAPNPVALSGQLEDAWRAYHAGDFCDAIARGRAAGAVGQVVAARAAAVYAAHLEDDEVVAMRMLREAAESCEPLLELAPDWANLHYVYGLALGRYGQRINVLHALAHGYGAKIRESLARAIELEPRHADAHLASGVLHAEVVAKVGPLMAAFGYGARRETALAHFEAALRLHPGSPVIRAEYARALAIAFGPAEAAFAHRMFAEAAACRPVDALERLDVEWARSEIG